jgi:LysR family transcriptional activator of glutamate synthase operon
VETRHLREFAFLAQVGNFGEVAEKFFISQSALSKHIKSLEEELGTPLFNRTGRGIVLNEYGKMLLPYAKQMVMLEDHFTKDIYNMRNDADHIIVIGTEYRITNLLSEFRSTHKDYLLSAIDANLLGEVRELLRTGKCELAFICNLQDPHGDFIAIPYVHEAIVAVLPTSHRLAKRKGVSLQELADEDFVMLPPTSPHTDFLLGKCHELGFSPKIVMTAPRGNEIIELVRAETGVSLLFGRLVSGFDTAGVVAVEVEPRVPMEISICYRKDAQLSSGARQFLDYVLESVSQS